MLYCAPLATLKLGQRLLRPRQASHFAGVAPSELARLQSLEATAVGELHDRYYPSIFRYSRFRLGDELAAEDVASEVFVRLIEAVRRGQGPRTSVLGWLMATAANLAADHYRAVYRHPQAELSEHVPAGGPQPDEAAAQAELGGQLQRALSTLTPDQQHVIALRFGAGLSLEETALSMGKDTNAIKALQFRALGALRRTMGEGAA